MAGRIRQEDVDTVRERTDLVQVVSGYLQLKKAGRDSMVGLCPFHSEKTPSLSVSPAKQVYFCFGCGEGGNVFRFLEKTENLSFVEAVERLAKDAGVALRYEGETAAGRRAVGRKQILHRVIEDAARVYHRMLLEGHEAAEARQYLGTRGVSSESTERFAIGYAPGYPDFLLKRLSRSYTPELLLEAGLVTRDEHGGIRDRFRGRVLFPIHDVSGNAVGFGGRLLAGPHAPAHAPKYLNSPETAVYRKGTLLYNLNRAKADITRTGRAFMVEGYTDVVGLDQAGLPATVATCGTALGEDHIRLLARFTERIVLAFDSDEAGARAADRAFQFHEAYPIDISVLVLPQGQDPADFVQANGGGMRAGEAFAELARQAVPLVEYRIDRLLTGRDLVAVEDRARAVREGLQIVVELQEQVRRFEYARVLAGKVGEPEMSVMLQLEEMLAAPPGDREQAGRARRSRTPPEEEVEWEALKLLVQAPQLCTTWLRDDLADRFAKPTHHKAFELILEASRQSGTAPSPQAAELVALAQARSEAQGRLLAALSVEPLRSEDDPTKEYAERLFLRLEEFSLKRRADVVRRQLERVNPIKAPADHESLFEELVALEGERRRVRQAGEAVGFAS